MEPFGALLPRLSLVLSQAEPNSSKQKTKDSMVKLENNLIIDQK